tara:strand:+ start:1345 stop:1797 length:453 start_codon:yes stop_codon:yes gene_type:complete
MTALQNLEKKPFKLDKETAQVLALRIQGKTYAQISKTLDVPLGRVRSRMSNLVKNVESNLDLEEMVYLELERLDHLTNAVWPDAMGGNDKAVNSVLRIMERRSKLIGLDAPVRHELSGPNGGAINIANWAEFVMNDEKTSDSNEVVIESD